MSTAPPVLAAPERAGLTDRLQRILFWALLATCIAAMASPIWVGRMPAATDFGAHVIMADTWSRMASEPWMTESFERRGGPVPNMAAAWFAWVTSPLLDTLTSLRLLITLAVVATALALVAVARVFRRSRWSVFLALPFVWNGMTALGLINFVACVPLMILAVALARRAGERGHLRYGAGLLLCTLGAYFAHGIGFLFVAAIAAGVLLASTTRARHLLHLSALAPSLALWSWWLLSAGPTRQGVDLATTMTAPEHNSVGENLSLLIRESLGVSGGGLERWILVLLCGTALATAIAGRWRRTRANAQGERPRGSTPRSAGPPSPGLRNKLRDLALPLLVLALVVGFFVLPHTIHGVAINTRLLGPTFMLAMLLAVRPDHRLAQLATAAVAIPLTLLFAWHMHGLARDFDEAELAPASRLLQAVPPRARAACIGVRDVTDPYRNRSLVTSCAGLVRISTGGFAGGGFAYTGFNAVRFREGRRPAGLDRSEWRWSARAHDEWDYFLVRGSHEPPDARSLELVEHAGPVEEPRWSLYRVRRTGGPPMDPARTHGGNGGRAQRSPCPEGRAMVGLAIRHDRLVNSARPLCADGPTAPTTPELGLVVGTPAGTSTVLRCPPGRVVVGLHGAAGRFVDRLGPICGSRPDAPSPGPQPGGTTISLRAVGGPGGATFEQHCPSLRPAVGIGARAGRVLDAVGLLCPAE